MISTLGKYFAFGVLEWQVIFQYGAWFWVSQFRTLLNLIVMTAFWQALYQGRNEIAGLGLTTTLSYVILARAIGEANTPNVFWWVAEGVAEGKLELEFLRPVDFQLMHLARDICAWGLNTVRALPALVVGVVVFGAKLPNNPWAYAAFALTFLLGGMVLYFFEFLFGCLGFYTTHIWGLGQLRNGIALFFSGALAPLTMLPEAWRDVASLTPFAQALYVPISFLSGVRDPNSLAQAVLVQSISVAVLALVSRLVFARAAQALTMQGG